MKNASLPLVLDDHLLSEKIHVIRGQRVMLDRDLAELYGVETKVLNQAVRRNKDRFPEDFMFILSQDEANSSRSQFVTLKRGNNIKYLPNAFTEQGVAMLSSVLSSERAIQVNIQIMRMFTKFRGMLEAHKELREKIDALEKGYDEQFSLIFRAIKQLITSGEEKRARRKIGFNLDIKRD